VRRREFITLLGGAASWPRAAHAQRAGRVWRIGFITHARDDAAYASLFERLQELGYPRASTPMPPIVVYVPGDKYRAGPALCVVCGMGPRAERGEEAGLS
jgi:hypothetical protein